MFGNVFGPGVPFFLRLPILETLLAQACTVLLIGAFLRYLSKQDEPAGLYMRISLPAIVICGLTVALLFPRFPPPGSLGPGGPGARLSPPPALASAVLPGQVPNPHRPPPPLLFPVVEGCAGLLAGLFGFLLTFRHLKGPLRFPMLCGIAIFTIRDTLKLASPVLFDLPGGPQDMEFRALTTNLGALFFAYIFVREHSAELQADFDSLEHRVQARTSELQSALAQLSEANHLLTEQSMLDPLTLVGNRRYFDDALSVEWARAAREGSSLAIAVVDLDKFKQINDSFGHHAGDACLLRVAQALRAATRRASDIVARYGGDEFIVVLPATDAEGAERVLENVRTHVDLANYNDDAAPNITMSIGIASCVPRDSGTLVELLRRADSELYQAKRAGRNQISSAQVPVVA